MLAALQAAGLILWSGCGDSSDDDEQPTTLLVERGQNPRGSGQELVVSVQGRANRDPSAASSSSEVGLVCVDAAGKTTVVARHRWPFLDEPGYPYPHVHQPVSPQQLEATVRCRLTDTQFPIDGAVRGEGG